MVKLLVLIYFWNLERNISTNGPVVTSTPHSSSDLTVMSRYVHHSWIIGLHSALCRRLYSTFGVLVPVRALCVRTATVEEKNRVFPFPFFRLGSPCTEKNVTKKPKKNKKISFFLGNVTKVTLSQNKCHSFFCARAP